MEHTVSQTERSRLASVRSAAKEREDPGIARIRAMCAVAALGLNLAAVVVLSIWSASNTWEATEAVATVDVVTVVTTRLVNWRTVLGMLRALLSATDASAAGHGDTQGLA